MAGGCQSSLTLRTPRPRSRAAARPRPHPRRQPARRNPAPPRSFNSNPRRLDRQAQRPPPRQRHRPLRLRHPPRLRRAERSGLGHSPGRELRPRPAGRRHLQPLVLAAAALARLRHPQPQPARIVSPHPSALRPGNGPPPLDSVALPPSPSTSANSTASPRICPSLVILSRGLRISVVASFVCPSAA